MTVADLSVVDWLDKSLDDWIERRPKEGGVEFLVRVSTFEMPRADGET